jgi:LysM repeat protein
LQTTNGIKNPRALAVGKELRIPVPRGAVAAQTSASPEPPAPRARGKSQKAARPVAVKAPDPVDKTKLLYTVRKGNTLGHIAEWYDCRAADIRNWNNIPYGKPIHEGQVLSIWVDSHAAEQYRSISSSSFTQNQSRKQAPAAAENDDGGIIYKVRSGDSLDKISKVYGASISQIKRWNKLSSSTIYPGQQLVIYPDAPKAQETTVASAEKMSKTASSPTIYKVRKGDTLWDIARAHNVGESELRAWNKLKANKIYAGQELVIYRDGKGTE